VRALFALVAGSFRPVIRILYHRKRQCQDIFRRLVFLLARGWGHNSMKPQLTGFSTFLVTEIGNALVRGASFVFPACLFGVASCGRSG